MPSRLPVQKRASEKQRPWKFVHGNAVYYNVPVEMRYVDVLEHVPMEMRRYPDAFVSKREIVSSGGGNKSERLLQRLSRESDHDKEGESELLHPWDQRFSRGAVYDKDGAMVPGFGRIAKLQPHKFDNPSHIERSRMDAAYYIPETCLYLGTLHGHFGHFLVESLARAWAALRVEKDMRVIFHYPNYAAVTTQAEVSLKEFPSYVSTIVDALGIEGRRLILAYRDLRVKELIVPDAQFWISDAASPNMCGAYDYVREEILRRKPELADGPRKIYLTRRMLNEKAPHKVRKSVSNEEEIEKLFTARGYEVVTPEKLPFDHQIAMIGQATHVAGTTGSALHMILFNGRPDAQLIAVDMRHSKTQYILDAARGISSTHIFCFDGRDSRGAVILNPEIVDRALSEIMPLEKPKDLPTAISELGTTKPKPPIARDEPKDVLAVSCAPTNARQLQVVARGASNDLLTPRRESVEKKQMQPATRERLGDLAAAPRKTIEAKQAKTITKESHGRLSTPQLSSGVGLRLFSDYFGVRPLKAAMAPQSAALWTLLNSVQKALDIKGNFLEIGVGIGGSALFGLLMLRPEEEAFFVDAKRDPAFDKHLGLLALNVRQRATFLEMRSDDARLNKLRAKSFRWVHIDANRTYKYVKHDIERFSQCVDKNGLLVLDDFFQMSWPDVTTVVYEFLRLNKEWAVLLIGFNKIYLVRAAEKKRYWELLDRSAKDFLGDFGSFALSSRIEMAGETVYCAKGTAQKAVALALAVEGRS